MNWSVITDFPEAADSPDILQPNGLDTDGHGNPEFVRLVGELFGRKLLVSDWGCAGGLLVSQFLAAGHDAVGVDGSDLPKRMGREAWACYPGNFLTADLARPFQLLANGSPAKLDVACAFEVCEHIHADHLPTFLSNLHSHLKDDGLFLGTIPSTYDPPWHLTVKFRGWWMKLFTRYGFEESEEGLRLLRTARPRGEVETCYSFRKRSGDGVQRPDGLSGRLR